MPPFGPPPAKRDSVSLEWGFAALAKGALTLSADTCVSSHIDMEPNQWPAGEYTIWPDPDALLQAKVKRSVCCHASIAWVHRAVAGTSQGSSIRHH
jgi:hypothetical protein